VKATTVSVRLRIYLFALTNTNKHFGAICRGSNWHKDFDFDLDVY
jgi:hypothetical protein